MTETSLKKENPSLWYKALDAFERKYGLLNPIRQKAGEVGKELTPTEFIKEFGVPLNHYPKDRIEEAYAFFVGYAGMPFKTYLRNIKQIKVVSLENELLDKITQAHLSGAKTALEERRLNLELQVKQS